MDIKDFNPESSSSPAPTPKPVPASPAASSATTSSVPAKPAGNLFAELNKGGDITSGLKTVTKDMQTWRQEYKADAAAPAPVAVKKAPVAARASEQVKGPPKLEYQAHGAKWLVENQSGVIFFSYTITYHLFKIIISKDSGVVTVTIQDIKQNVYIFGCIGATVNIDGKCKSIVIDSCKKTKVFFYYINLCINF